MTKYYYVLSCDTCFNDPDGCFGSQGCEIGEDTYDTEDLALEAGYEAAGDTIWNVEVYPVRKGAAHEV